MKNTEIFSKLNLTDKDLLEIQTNGFNHFLYYKIESLITENHKLKLIELEVNDTDYYFKYGWGELPEKIK